MWGMQGAWGGMMLLYGLIWIAVVAVGLTALWRSMRAQETMASHLAELARELGRRERP